MATTLGPDEAILMPAGWITCERTLSSSAFGLRRVVYDLREEVLQRILDCHAHMNSPGKLFQVIVQAMRKVRDLRGSAGQLEQSAPELPAPTAPPTPQALQADAGSPTPALDLHPSTPGLGGPALATEAAWRPRQPQRRLSSFARSRLQATSAAWPTNSATAAAVVEGAR
eukprot:15462220-Alexandrium_andersonii.AAC.1